MNVVELWSVLDSLNPMPMSRTRDRICGWIADCHKMGLINSIEAGALLASDDRDRQRS